MSKRQIYISNDDLSQSTLPHPPPKRPPPPRSPASMEVLAVTRKSVCAETSFQVEQSTSQVAMPGVVGNFVMFSDAKSGWCS